MARDLKALYKEWTEHPCLLHVACKDVQELSEYLERLHKYMVSDEATASGYLYQQQIKRNQQLRKELEQCQMQMQHK